jgi:hypothetical protein
MAKKPARSRLKKSAPSLALLAELQTARELRRVARVEREIQRLTKRIERLVAQSDEELLGLARYVATNAGYRLVEIEHQPAVGE